MSWDTLFQFLADAILHFLLSFNWQWWFVAMLNMNIFHEKAVCAFRFWVSYQIVCMGFCWVRIPNVYFPCPIHFQMSTTFLCVSPQCGECMCVHTCMCVCVGGGLLMFPDVEGAEGQWYWFSFPLPHFSPNISMFICCHFDTVFSAWDLSHLLLYALQHISTGHSDCSDQYLVSQRTRFRRDLWVSTGIGGTSGVRKIDEREQARGESGSRPPLPFHCLPSFHPHSVAQPSLLPFCLAHRLYEHLHVFSPSTHPLWMVWHKILQHPDV